MAEEHDQLPHGEREITMVGLAHPADRAVVDFFGRVLAAGNPTVAVRLVTDAASTGSLQIRSEALDAVRLAATANLPGSALSRERYAEAGRQGATRPGMPTLSIERVLCDPLEALRNIGESLGITFTTAHMEAARRGLPELQDQVGPYLHPLRYLSTCGGIGDPAPHTPKLPPHLPADIAFVAHLAPGAPVLVVAKAREGAFSAMGPNLDRLDVIAIDGASGSAPEPSDAYPLSGLREYWPDVRPFQPHLLYLHDMARHPDLPGVFEWALDQMALDGRLAGREADAGAMHLLLAGLTRRAGGGFDFILDGAHWSAVPPTRGNA